MNKKKFGARTSGGYLVFTYALFVALFAIGIFIYGFFPVKCYNDKPASIDDVPQFIESIRIDRDDLYKPLVKRVVLMVIDAFRWDFIAGPLGAKAMPFTTSLINNNTACLTKIKINPPTVTLPRIKAITTGTVPNFIDVALNLEGTASIGDNIILQAKKRGNKMVFYGDDTWLKLFPHHFERSDGTTSFFVSDFTEVDNNVTRHLDDELRNKDWSIMILHYLGLDHIGHVLGPQSSRIVTKLQEMDDVIKQIFTETQRASSEPTLFMICGDHGMKNSGGHGGSSLEEITVPLISIGANCPKNNATVEALQVDIGVTLSVMMGLPIPASSLGSVLLHLLDDLPLMRQLYFLYYNSEQVFRQFSKLSAYDSSQTFVDFQSVKHSHVQWLNNKSYETANSIIQGYIKVLDEMKETVISSAVEYNISYVVTGIFFIFQALYIASSERSSSNFSFITFVNFIVINVILWMISNNLLIDTDSTKNSHKGFDFLFICVCAVFIVNSYLCTTTTFYTPLQLPSQYSTIHFLRWIVYIAILLHSLSFASSSFIEEEHQTHYYFWVTIFVFFMYDRMQTIISSFQSTEKGNSLWSAIQLFFVLMMHRVLRKLNSTGDKFAHLPDISDWLQEENHKYRVTTVAVIGLALLIILRVFWENQNFKKWTFFINLSLAISIYMRHMATDSVLTYNGYPQSKGIKEVKMFWLLSAISSAISLFRISRAMLRKDKTAFSELLHFIIQTWVMTSAMIHRPYNIILLPVQVIFSAIIHKISDFYGDDEINVYLHCWLGSVFYFYQGNSNGLATVDVAAGYVGLESFQSSTVAMFLAINTYSSVVLAYLLLLYGISLKRLTTLDQGILLLNKRYVSWKLLSTSIFMIIITLHRYHLFIWTVFSPKLLYEAANCIIMFTIVFLIQCFFLGYWKIIKSELCTDDKTILHLN